MPAARALDIVYVGTLPPHHGGSALMSAQLLEQLAARGHAVRAIAPITEAVAAGGDPYARLAHRLDIRRYLVPRFETSPDVAPEGDDERTEFEQVDSLLAELVAERRPDVLVAGRESFAFTVSELARDHRLPWLQMIQGSTAIGILRGTYDAERAARLIDRLRSADAIVTPARHLAAALGRLGVGRIEVVRNPVDLERFRPGRGNGPLRTELGIDRDALVVSHVSNLKSLKRCHDLVEAADLLRERLPHARYVVLGSGPGRTALTEAVEARCLGDRFRFVAWVPHDRVPGFMAMTDVVVMPSAGEAQALVYLEAQASGCTLVASDIPAAREVVEHGANGLLFPVGDVEALARALERAADPDVRAGIGRRAAETVRTHALPATATGYERLLLGIAGPPRGRRGKAADVSVVVLTLGEETTERALASVRRQTLQPAEIVVVEQVTPFVEALRAGVRRSAMPHVLQVDADMVLDDTCVERLRAAMTMPELGIAVGQLRDPLMGTIAGIKLFRRVCFDEVSLRDSVTPDVDFYFDLADLGWLTQHVLSYTEESRPPHHTFGDHLPELTPAYTYATYLLLGCRYFSRRDLRGLLWRYERLRGSAHPSGLLARVALSCGVLHEETRDVPKSAVVGDPTFLASLAGSTGVPGRVHGLTLPVGATSRDWYLLGRELRSGNGADAFRATLAAFEALPPAAAWPREAAFCHGFWSPADAAEASAARIGALTAGHDPTGR